MNSIKKKMRGFTLVEVMVVVIIIAVLAAVAIPLMTGNVKRAISTEGIAGLGTTRSNLRAMLAENGDYTETPSGNVLGEEDVMGAVPGFSSGDLDGRYFSDNDYSIVAIDESNFVLQVEGDGTDLETSPGAKRAEGFKIWMTSRGTIKLNTTAGGEDDDAPGLTD